MKFTEDKGWRRGGLFFLKKETGKGKRWAILSVHGFDVWVEITILQPQSGKDKGQKASN